MRSRLRLPLSSFRFLLLLTLIVLPGLAACAGGDDDDDRTEPTATEVLQSDATATDQAAAGTSPTAEETRAADQAATDPAKSAADQELGDKVLRVHQRYYPTILDPQQASFTEEIAVLLLNYEGLTRLDENLDTVPGAAEEWEYSADGTQLTFILRQGLTYSDGSPLTAEYFRYAVERTCDPNVAGPYQSILFDIVGCAELSATDPTDQVAYDEAKAALGVQAPDDRTLVVDLTHPAPYFHTIASLWVFFPAKQELIEEGGDSWWKNPELQVGNGPFQLIRMEEEQLVTLRVNENYWQGEPALDGFEYVYQPDSAVALEAYRAGQVDIYKPDPTQLGTINDDDELADQLLSYPNASTSYLTFNVTQEPFNDPKVRQAFAFAFDRATYCEQIRSGDCVPTLSFIPPGVPGAIETDMFAFDPEAAQQALAESSYGNANTLPEITYVYVNDDPAEQPRAEWLAGQYRDILGIDIKLEGMESNAWVELMSAPDTWPQFTGLGWVGDYPDPQNWLSTVWTCDGLNSPSGYCNEEFDQLTAEADSELDESQRMELYQQAGELLVEDQPAVFIYNSLNLFLVKPEVSGYETTAGDFEWPGQRASEMTIDVDR